MWYDGIIKELDSSISMFDFHNKTIRKYAYADPKRLLQSLTIMAKQICISRITEKLHFRISDGIDNSKLSMCFESHETTRKNGETSLLDASSSLEFNPDAIKSVIELSEISNFEVKMFREENISHIDFIFGRNERNVNGTFNCMDFDFIRTIIRDSIDAF